MKILFDGTKHKICFMHQWFILKKKRKLGVIFIIRKNTKPGLGVGVEGGLANHHTFYLIFSVKPSLR